MLQGEGVDVGVVRRYENESMEPNSGAVKISSGGCKIIV